MGYFSSVQLAEIQEKEAYCVTRIPSKVLIYLPDNQELETLLKKTQLHHIDSVVTLSSGDKMRLVGRRATREKRAQKQRQRRATAKRKNRKVSQRGLLFDGWHLALTNLTETEATPSEIMALYRARWAVEIGFRAWKQGFQLSVLQKHRTGDGHMKVLLYTAMIAHQLMMLKAAHLLKHETHCRISIEKLSHWVSSKFSKLMRLGDFFKIDPDPRYVSYQKRKRRNLRESTIRALT